MDIRLHEPLEAPIECPPSPPKVDFDFEAPTQGRKWPFKKRKSKRTSIYDGSTNMSVFGTDVQSGSFPASHVPSNSATYCDFDGLMGQMDHVIKRIDNHREQWVNAKYSKLSKSEQLTRDSITAKITQVDSNNGKAFIKVLRVKIEDTPFSEDGQLKMILDARNAEAMKLAVGKFIRIYSPWKQMDYSGSMYLSEIFWIDVMKAEDVRGELISTTEPSKSTWDCPCRVTTERPNPIPTIKCKPAKLED
jgi:hypothetical protein